MFQFQNKTYLVKLYFWQSIFQPKYGPELSDFFLYHLASISKHHAYKEEVPASSQQMADYFGIILWLDIWSQNYGFIANVQTVNMQQSSLLARQLLPSLHRYTTWGKQKVLISVAFLPMDQS